eukprot:1110720-Amphidinium_carterae.3
MANPQKLGDAASQEVTANDIRHMRSGTPMGVGRVASLCVKYAALFLANAFKDVLCVRPQDLVARWRQTNHIHGVQRCLSDLQLLWTVQLGAMPLPVLHKHSTKLSFPSGTPHGTPKVKLLKQFNNLCLLQCLWPERSRVAISRTSAPRQ